MTPRGTSRRILVRAAAACLVGCVLFLLWSSLRPGPPSPEGQVGTAAATEDAAPPAGDAGSPADTPAPDDAPAPGQDPPEPTEAEGPEDETEEAQEEPEDKKPELVPVSLKGAPIEQVVKFLSETTGKVVLQSKDAQAKITVMSPEPVAPERAVELICEALRMDGVAVVERGDVLYLLPLEQLPTMGVETLGPAGDIPASGLVRKVIELKFADVARVEKLVTPLLGKGSKLVADADSRKVIVTAPARDLQDLQQLIAQIDVLQIRDTQVRIFQLEHADTADVAKVVQVILQDDGKAGGQQPGQRQPKPDQPPGQTGAKPGVAVVAYPTANWLVVRATQEKLEAAELLIAELDREKPPEVELKVILVRHGDAQELARQLTALFSRRPGTRSVRDMVELTADQRSNALICYSTAANFDLVREIVRQLDTEESRQTETRSFQLTYADAEDVAEQLNDLYSGLQDTSSYYDYFYYRPRGRSDTVKTRFVPERRTNTIIVIAPPQSFDQVEALIEKLDQPINKTEISPRIYRIRNIDAQEITDVLNQIFGVDGDDERGGGYYYYLSRSRSQDTQVGRLYGKVRFVSESATNSLIVITNNKENFSIIEDLIEQLDRSVADFANTLVYRLENADATELADQLNTLFSPPGAGRPGEQREAEEGGTQQTYYSWMYGAPDRDEAGKRISNLIGEVRVVPDPRTNSLLITSAVQNFEVLRQLILQLDIESPKVLIEIELVEIVRSREDRKGVRWTSDSSIFESQDFNNGLLSFLGVSWEEVTTDTVLSADVDVAVLVQFLQREFDARVLSSPSLVVNNNTEATIFVGQEIPFINESQSEPGTTARNDSFEYREVGTKLVIKPHINDSDKVVTSIQLTASKVREGETLFGGAILDTRNYDTELAVDSGQTVVIGGIMRQEEAEIINRVPILGHIPVLKWLFSKKDKVVTTTELIAFITPTVLRDRTDDDETTQKQRDQMDELDKWRSTARGGP